jgi:Acyl-CoA oxidase
MRALRKLVLLSRTSLNLYYCDTNTAHNRHRAARLVSNVAALLAAQMKQGATHATAWNMALVEIMRASRAHCLLLVLEVCTDNSLLYILTFTMYARHYKCDTTFIKAYLRLCAATSIRSLRLAARL